MSHTPTRPSQAISADLLADGIRYERGGVVARARECFEAAARTVEQAPAEAAEAWWRLANLHRLHSSWEDALAAARTSVQIAQAHGLRNTEADALNIEGAVWSIRGEYDTARALYTRMLSLASTQATRAKALQNLGTVAAEERDFDEGERLFAESREAYRAAGDARGEANSLLNIGRLQLDRGFADLASHTLDAAVAAARQTGDLEMHAAAMLNHGKLRYVGRNTTSILTMQQLERTANRGVLQRKLEGNGIAGDRSEELSSSQVRVETERLSTRGRGGSGTIGVLFALSIAITLYLTIFIHGSNVMRGVLEEKQTRVAEVVLSSVNSDTLLMGKVIGIGAVGFTQLTAWIVIATGMVYLRAPILAKFGIQAPSFALPELNATMGIVILMTFLLGFLFYAALFAMVGAIVSTEQDAQQAQMPVVLLLGLTLSTVQGILTNPEGLLARVLTVVPFSSPIVLPLRLSLAPLSDREVMLSLGTLSVSAIAATFLAARLYRVGILMYGKRPTLREALRWIGAR